MIELKKIKKSFGSQTVLNDLNLVIPKGQITLIIGRSGEGKSVLLKHFIGLLKPDAGQVFVNGEDITKKHDFELNEIRKQFGMLFQYAALFDSMTVFENIAFPMIEHTQLSEAQIQKRVDELIQIVGLTSPIINRYPSELSGGMRKRVGLARAIALKPKILLYDEPTTGLDPVMADVIDHLILNTQRKLKITSVVISHDVKVIFKIADKIAFLHEGKIHFEGTPADFKNCRDETVKNFLEGKASPEQLKEL